jgi:hypothetical protein
MSGKEDQVTSGKKTRLETKFWIRNFTLYANVTQQRDYTLVESSVLFLFSFYMMAVAFSHGYKIYSRLPDSSLQTFLQAASYSNMYSLLTMMKEIYLGLLFTSALIGIFYFLLFIYFILRNKTKARKSILATLFKLLCKYYSWMFYFPTSMLFFSRIFCTESIMNPLEKVCKNTGGANILELTAAVLGLATTTFMTMWTSFFFCSSNYRKKNYFASNHPSVYLLINIRKLLLALFLTISTTSSQYLSFFLIANLSCSLILLFYFLRIIPFAKLIILREALFFETALMSICFGFILDELARGKVYEGSNTIFFCGSCFLIFEVFVQFFLKDHLESIALEFEKNEDKIEFSLFLKRIEVLDLLTSSIDDYENLFFKGLMERHMQSCLKENCFCKKEVMYDSKKNKEYNLENKYSHKSIFAKMLVKASYENYMSHHPKESLPLIYFAEFLFEKMKNLHLALMQLYQAERRVLMIDQRNKVYIVRKNIRNYNKKINIVSFKGKLEIEAVVFTEEQMDKILDTMKKILRVCFLIYLYKLSINKISKIFLEVLTN